MLGSEVTAGNGGMLRNGVFVGKLGSGGIVSLGRDGMVVGIGNGGKLTRGNVGIEGKGGNVVGLGKVGMLGKFGCEVACKRLRASRLMLDIATTKSKVMVKDFIVAIDNSINFSS